jgi:UDP-N-acetyl-D-glucosamine dehydrogenase
MMTPASAINPQPNEQADQLKEKIINRTAKVGVIGLGYVGLPLAVEKGKVGFEVTGFDRSAKRVAQVNAGDNYIKDVKDEDLKSLVAGKKLTATDDFSRLAEVDVIVICVPTPLTVTRDPDISYIVNVTGHIAQYLRNGQLVTLESTTYPGTTAEVILPKLAAGGKKVGEDFFLPSRPNGSIPATNATRPRTPPRWSAGLLRRAWMSPPHSIARRSPRSCPFPRPQSPK